MNKDMQKAITALKNGECVIFPTDTVYGIFAGAFDKGAAKKIFKIKKRDNKKPLQVFFDGMKTLEKYVLLNARQKKILKKNLPGPYTVILKLKPKYKTAFSFLKNGTVGARIIKNKYVSTALKVLKTPLAATSANISGEPAPRKFKEINHKLLSKIAVFIKDDSTVSGTASRVIDITGEKIVILR